MSFVWRCFSVTVSLLLARPDAVVPTSGRLAEMITIPAGTFIMGSNEDAANERPQHAVHVAKFQMAKYETTRGEYRRFIMAGGYQQRRHWSNAGWKWKIKKSQTEPVSWQPSQNWGSGFFVQTDQHPVVGVSYYEAEAYCRWAGGRLPTEAEWEKAARWTGSHANVYPWGDTWDDEKCNNWKDSNDAGGGIKKYQTAPVGSYPTGASPYGCQDMAGNVMEWTADWYRSYKGSIPVVDHTGTHRVFRGGGWNSYGAADAEAGRASFRLNYSPGNGWYGGAGFRIAR